MHNNERCMSTYSHPDGKSDPCSSVQLHHQVDIDKHAYDWNERQQGNLENRTVLPHTNTLENVCIYLKTFKTNTFRKLGGNSLKERFGDILIYFFNLPPIIYKQYIVTAISL